MAYKCNTSVNVRKPPRFCRNIFNTLNASAMIALSSLSRFCKVFWPRYLSRWPEMAAKCQLWFPNFGKNGKQCKPHDNLRRDITDVSTRELGLHLPILRGDGVKRHLPVFCDIKEAPSLWLTGTGGDNVRTMLP